jgi:hypothetical protein
LDDVLREHDTGIMGKFTCANQSCPIKACTSKQIAITIREYSGLEYNARVYHQRCKSCNSLSRPELDTSYAERVSYRLAKWSGIDLEEPPYSGHSQKPHQSRLCEGCRHGHCWQSRLYSPTHCIIANSHLALASILLCDCISLQQIIVLQLI